MRLDSITGIIKYYSSKTWLWHIYSSTSKDHETITIGLSTCCTRKFKLEMKPYMHGVGVHYSSDLSAKESLFACKIVQIWCVVKLG